MPLTCTSLLDSVSGGEGDPPPSGVWPPGRRELCVLQGGSPLRSICLFEDLVSSSPVIRQSCSDSYHLREEQGAGGALPEIRLRQAGPRGSRARHLPHAPPIPVFPL